ncbi:putative ribokinase [Ancylostoma duodenale]|uniref:Ribokinase n=1 Tax=Ancylostoma duodenale TaxID=51022 RepID=A0A0C2GRT6_9BILA|nr:putative ribokinase [Ancylostoma duodenale]
MVDISEVACDEKKISSYMDEFPRPGESVGADDFIMRCAGKGANQAVAAARLGAKVQLIAKVGDDQFGKSNIDNLTVRGVDIDRVELVCTPTATATVFVNSEGENCIATVLGANLELDKTSAKKYESALKGASLVLIQAEVSPLGNKKIFKLAKKHGVKTFFNASPGDPDMDMSIVELTDILCTNQIEMTFQLVNENNSLCPLRPYPSDMPIVTLRLILAKPLGIRNLATPDIANDTQMILAEFVTGIPQESFEDAKNAAAQMLTMGPEHVIITLGAKGCILASKDELIEHIPVKKVTAVDTTGAGDCFCGSLAYFIGQGKFSMRDAVAKSAAIATLSVLKQGTQSSYRTREEILCEYPYIFD